MNTENRSKSGIYKITNILDGNFYYGSTNCFERRWKDHKSDLLKGKHHSKKLQHAWDKYRADAFIFEVLEIVVGDKLLRTTVEQKYLDEIKDWKRCYNIKKETIQKQGPWSSTPEETRKKMSDAKKGITPWNKGKHFTEESKQKMSCSQRNKKPISEETRKKMSKATRGKNNPNYGKTMSEEQKRKISNSKKGKTIISQEQRQNHSKMMKGRKFTEEHRKNMSKSMKGKKHKPLSNEHKQKISNALRGKKKKITYRRN